MFKFIRMAPKTVFAVARGRQLGIFNSWEECNKSVHRFSKAKFKGFATLKEAENYLLHTGAGESLTVKPLNNLPEIVPKPPKASFAKIFNAASKKSTASTSTSSTNQDKTQIEFNMKDSDDEIFLNLEEHASQGSPKSKSPKPAAVKKKTKTVKKPKTIKKELPSYTFDSPQTTSIKMYNGHKFNEDKDGFVHVYTDGSCIGSAQNRKAGFGVFFGADNKYNLSEPVEGRATNNVGEIRASIEAIRIAQSCGIKRLNIFTDSQFLIKSAVLWMKGWKANDWKSDRSKPVLNKVEFVELDKIIEKGNLQIKWSYIAAHKGFPGNTEADELAKEGAEKYCK
ncbi:unnamed protein product [Diamesa hyperborea]